MITDGATALAVFEEMDVASACWRAVAIKVSIVADFGKGEQMPNRRL